MTGQFTGQYRAARIEAAAQSKEAGPPDILGERLLRARQPVKSLQSKEIVMWRSMLLLVLSCLFSLTSLVKRLRFSGIPVYPSAAAFNPMECILELQTIFLGIEGRLQMGKLVIPENLNLLSGDVSENRHDSTSSSIGSPHDNLLRLQALDWLPRSQQPSLKCGALLPWIARRLRFWPPDMTL